MPFGEVVCGSPGSGKSTYCYGKHQLFSALNRPITIVNLDPANENIPYPCAIDISSLITLKDVMEEHGLGPNGGMLYCLEYLEVNYDWLEDRLKELGPDAYVLFDLPGQVELSTNHDSVKRIVQKLTKSGFRLAAVHLCDAHYVTDASKYISVLLLSLRTMLHLELPHINVLSKVDLLKQYGELDFNLDFYTEVQDLSYLENALSASSPRFAALNMAIISLIEDFSLVGFETLAVEDKDSMIHLTRAIDRATGYVYIPPTGSQAPPGTIDESDAPSAVRPNTYALFSSAAGPMSGPLSDVRDVQERWIDAREEYDAYENRKWRQEGEMVRDEVARGKNARERETLKLLKDGIINNPLHASAPPELHEASDLVEYQGPDDPSIPINWRFAESISAIKGFQACMVNVLLKRKYGIAPQKVVINTDHACLMFLSWALSEVDVEGKKCTVYSPEFSNLFPSQMKDPHHQLPHNTACTNIYKTKDGKFYHTHGSLDSTQTQAALGIPHVYEAKPGDSIYSVYEEKVAQHDASLLDKLINDEYRQAGTICQTVDEYLSSEHGKANAHVGLYEVHHVPNPSQKPSWWSTPEGTRADPSRPLFGLKVVDLTRIIAAPTIGRELAELGASVMRITSPNISDMQPLNFDLGWGKWNAHLDLKQEADRKKLKELIKECDVVIEGYRPGVMKKWGFGKEDILKMVEGREKGIVYVHENCYGWNGPLSYRSGWQQISDAHCGVSMGYGRAMGHDEAVTPVFPNSDYCTGAAGAIGAIQALIERGEKGGSFVVDVALNYYSQWLVSSCGEYPKEVWKSVWEKHGKPVFHHKDNMQVTVPALLGLLKKNTPHMFDASFFETRYNKALGTSVRTTKPIVNFPDGIVKLGFNVGCRPNGVDKAQWPADLMTEVVA
ncbi:hypothetical protein VNI00_008050 [Paramarasmius palmivorus]|uniref:ATP-binding domain 1 family member B homolog n=1 Tax=Paramarasmius palmivorus TaxID=297713 RepID=A0AAW0CXR9_9AGAR